MPSSMAAERGAAAALRGRFARTLPTRSPGPAHGSLSVNHSHVESPIA